MIARENISQTKTSNHTRKLQTLNEENSTIKTGNIPSDNENLLVNSTRRVADVTGFYSNRKTTGAEGTPKSHLAEVDCIMQVFKRNTKFCFPLYIFIPFYSGNP